MNASTPNAATPLYAASTLSALLQANRGAARSLTYLEGERETRSVSFGELYERALGSCTACSGSAPGPATS